MVFHSISRTSVLRKLLRSRKNSRAFATEKLLNPQRKYDIVVVGGGIVGAATAREIKKRHPQLQMAIVEKENKLAVHQSGHNSGVIHTGIYYTPGSLKAKLCVEGMKLTYEYVKEKNIPYKQVGKLIVATDEIEIERLMELHRRGLENKVPGMELIDGPKIQEIEPLSRGLKALWSPMAGIIDYALVTAKYGEDFTKDGGEIHFNFKVDEFKLSTDTDYPVRLTAKDGTWVLAKNVLTCCGLQSDQVAELTGCSMEPKIIPFRGEYLLLDPKLAVGIKTNIYPVPDPRFPFLGVHVTPRMDGSVWLGPNAVLALKREGYSWTDIDLAELFDALKYPGMQKLCFKYMGYGMKEMSRSIFTSLQVKQLTKFLPSLKLSDVRPGPSGVRAQALDINGNLVDDFYFDESKGELSARVLHCRNAPSPGATSSQAIARMIADKIQAQFKIN